MLNNKESHIMWESYNNQGPMATEEQLIWEAYTSVYESYTDKVQAALDIIGIEPTIGTGADVANVVISSLRAAASDETDERKKHLINAAISAVSLIPGADLIKLLKLSRPAKKLAIKGLRATRAAADTSKQSGQRFT